LRGGRLPVPAPRGRADAGRRHLGLGLSGLAAAAAHFARVVARPPRPGGHRGVQDGRAEGAAPELGTAACGLASNHAKPQAAGKIGPHPSTPRYSDGTTRNTSSTVVSPCATL